MIRNAGALAFVLLGIAAASAQTVERKLYVMSPDMRQTLEAHQFDSGQVERIVNGVAGGLSSGDLKPILDNAAPQIRITTDKVNSVVDKGKLADFKARLLKAQGLERDVADEDQFIVKGDEVGLARGAFWIDVQCLDDACSKKKSSIVTINLP